MKIWAIADLHLCFGAPNKSMEIFGASWLNYLSQIKENWTNVVHPEDLVLIAGDISWAMHLKEAMEDLTWIASLPGTKVLLKGNHDYWWPSHQKLKNALPPSIHCVHHNAWTMGEVSIGGARLWDTEEYSFKEHIAFVGPPLPKKNALDLEQREKIYCRELSRLRLSLKQLDPKAKYRIAMTHYPPIGFDLKKSRASEILEEFGVHVSVFGHLHNVKKKPHLFGKKNDIRYLLTSADYLNFKPKLVEDLSTTSPSNK